MPEPSFLEELRKRKVVQAAAIYGAVAWGLTEVVVTVVQHLFLPQWLSTLAVVFFVVGFPIAMFLAWTFDLTAEGIRRTEVTSRRGKASIALSMLLLGAGTAGLFLLIDPALEKRDAPEGITPNSVAVLPFDYSGPNINNSYLGPGLSDELRDQLGRIEGLRIAARLSSIAAVQTGSDAKATAVTLGVEHLLEGNMSGQGNVLRVSVRLIDGASGLAVWNGTFERGRKELLNLQQEIAEAVVREVLPGSDLVVAKPATLNATANELLLLGRHHEQQVRDRETVNFEALQRAIHYYRQATEADPASALARSRLAGALLYLGDLDEAEAHASAALLLDPKLAEVQHTFGKILFARGSPNMGEPLARAVELNPNLPDALASYAFWKWLNVSTDGVADLYRRALELDPLNVERYGALGQFLAIYDQPDEARALAEKMQTTFDHATGYRAIAKLYHVVGDVDYAIAWTIKASNAEPNNPLHTQKLAEYYADIGDFETAVALEPDTGVGLLFKMRRYDEMIDKAELQMIDYPEDIPLRVYLGFAYNVTGRFEDAIRIVDSSGILENYSHSRRNPEEIDGFKVLLDAAYGSGEIDKARELARFEIETHYRSKGADWWLTLGQGCRFAILGEDNTVYRLLQQALESDHLALEPMLKDLHCFKRFQDDPVYLAVIEHFDDRRAMLRERLPTTLAQYGVGLN